MAQISEIQLPAHLTINKVQALQEILERFTEDSNKDRVVIHAAEVERVDTAGIQLLYAFVQEARRRGMALEWDQPSAKLAAAAELLGMLTALEISRNAH
jgi:anti-anti-sigma regulatory factor